MKTSTEHALAKVPEVTLAFWLLKIAATTLGETGGDAVSMSMNLGYLVGTGIFAAVFLVSVAAQIKAKGFHPLLYWTTIIATTTVGTTLADFADRSLGIGYAGGSTLLLALLLGSLFAWYRTLGSVSVSTVHSPRAEAFYWVTIMFSQIFSSSRASARCACSIVCSVLFCGAICACITPSACRAASSWSHLRRR